MQRPVPGEIYVTAFLLFKLYLTRTKSTVNRKDIAPSFRKPDPSFIENEGVLKLKLVFESLLIGQII